MVGFCGGSGITPVMSIAKHVLATTERPVRLLYANRDRDSVIFEDGAGRSWRGQHRGRLEVRHHFDVDGGFLTEDDVAAFVRGRRHRRRLLHLRPRPVHGPGRVRPSSELGVEPERIFIERFLVEQQEKDAAIDGGRRTAGAIERAVRSHGDPQGKKVVVAYQPGDTLLETARRGGLRPPFSCEAGNCATCMAFLKEGSVTMRANNALTPEEVEEGWILTCQSVPSGPTVLVEYEAM